jgi:hypothetical protein
MEGAFGIVIFVVVGVAVVLALVTFAQRDEVYDQIGRGGIGDEREAGPRDRPAAGAAALDTAERDAEIRQMLEARSARRVAKGGAPLDVEAELAALTRPQVDAALRAEIRELVESRNRRRVRKGQEPLDVEAEVERQVRDLAG